MYVVYVYLEVGRHACRVYWRMVSVCSIIFCLIPLRQDPSQHLDQVCGQQAPVMPPPLLPTVGGVTGLCLAFYLGVGYLNLAPHAHVVSVLTHRAFSLLSSQITFDCHSCS